METILAIFGGLLLLLSLSSGLILKSRFLQADDSSVTGDRVAAAAIGASLVGLAVAIRIGAPTASLIGTYAVSAAFAAIYGVYLVLGKNR